MIKLFLIKYKTLFIGVLLVWAFIAFINYFAIRPYVEQNKALIKSIKKREIENKTLNKIIKKDSILLAKKTKLIEKYEKEEKRYKDLKPLIQIKYEKIKTDYYSNDVVKRKRIFTKLANE
jgi:hypothetical protein